MSANTSRRTILAGAATLPALAVPALAFATGADAELIELGKQYAVLAKQFEVTRKLSEPHWDAFRSIGRSRGDELISNEEYEEIWKQADAVAPLPKPDCDELCEMMAPIAERIFAIPATTIAGLAAKAVVSLEAAGCYPPSSKAFDDLDWKDKCSAAVAYAVIALAGGDHAG